MDSVVVMLSVTVDPPPLSLSLSLSVLPAIPPASGDVWCQCHFDANVKCDESFLFCPRKTERKDGALTLASVRDLRIFEFHRVFFERKR